MTTGPIGQPRPSSVAMTMNEDPGVPSGFLVDTRPMALSTNRVLIRRVRAPK